MKIEHIYWDGKKVVFRYMEDGENFIEARRRLGRMDYCPLCGELFTPGTMTSVVLVWSNQVGIPDRICHAECFAEHTPEIVFNIIAGNFELYLKFKETFKGWTCLTA